jgi:heat-inducible transcriptional repressor
MKIDEFNERTREVFRQIVETYLETGEPVGSRTLSKALDLNISPASIRNVMADLEDSGLLYAPHTSAGRLPTDIGLRLFVDGLLELGNLTEAERQEISGQCAATGNSLEQVLEQAGAMLSGLSQGAGVVLAPKSNATLRHVEFVSLGPGRALMVLVSEDGQVENRLLDVPADMLPSTLTMAGNYLNARLAGRSLETAKEDILAELARHEAELDNLASRLVEDGLALWSKPDSGDQMFIVRGQSNLLENLQASEDLERVRKLIEDLENKREFVHLLDLAHDAEGVRVFIGSENKLFSMSGSSLILSPYMNASQSIVGVVGVIGPTRMNYARVVPMVDYTARVIGRLLG